MGEVMDDSPRWSWYPPTLLFFIIFSSASHIIRGPASGLSSQYLLRWKAPLLSAKYGLADIRYKFYVLERIYVDI